ncbi:MAG: DUF2461 domain-containing protein [Cytophagales bacterium]|nr:DUF2461 domain-containing protein [Bernardetiaceae bacterium]MDW8205850.1 DUF2461 domain-containing protein [Cytophagales bacterium]
MKQSALAFLMDLKANNSREWFAENKQRYEQIAADFLALADDILRRLSQVDPAFATQKAKDCVFRIYRDTRFSKDKTPYKTHLGAYFCTGGKQSPLAGYYLHIQPGESFLAGGCWMPPAPLLQAIRQEIDYNAAEFRNIVESPAFAARFGKLSGESLKTAPKGYSADHPEIEYLRKKSFVAVQQVSDQQVLADDFIEQIMEAFAAMKPLVDFLNRAITDVAFPA